MSWRLCKNSITKAAVLLAAAVVSVSSAAAGPYSGVQTVFAEEGAAPDGFGAFVFRDAVFDAAMAEGNDEAQVDMSAASLGYVGLHCETDAKIKFQVVKDDLTVTYSVENGRDQIFPLQSGDGHYVFKVMKNIEEKKYAELYRCEADVVIGDEFDPFLRPNQYTEYTQDSEAVKLAAEIAGTSSGEEDYIAKIYDFICSNITYDYVLAETVQSGYLPDPDRTLAEKKGICMDYASLAAAMLRSQGIPTKIIFGYVAPDDIYHAWNKFYTEEGGWMLVEFKVNGNDWNRIDLTFYANSADPSFIGDGSNYMEAYQF